MDISNLTEKELKELNKLTQEKLTAIEKEKARKEALKKAYALKDVPSAYQVNYASLGIRIKQHFENSAQAILNVDTFNELLKQCTNEIKPKREEIYCCPNCGEYHLEVGDWGELWQHKYAVSCCACDFEIKKKVHDKLDAWETFHIWLIKNGYLNKDVEFQW